MTGHKRLIMLIVMAIACSGVFATLSADYISDDGAKVHVIYESGWINIKGDGISTTIPLTQTDYSTYGFSKNSMIGYYYTYEIATLSKDYSSLSYTSESKLFKMYTKVKLDTDYTAKECFEKGREYYEGKTQTQNYAMAYKWFKIASDKGDPFAQNYLGRMYNFGEGVTKDIEESYRYYTMSAEGKHIGSQLVLNIKYFHGFGCEPDYIEAYKWAYLAHYYASLDGSVNLDIVNLYVKQAEEKLNPAQKEMAISKANAWINAHK